MLCRRLYGKDVYEIQPQPLPQLSEYGRVVARAAGPLTQQTLTPLGSRTTLEATHPLTLHELESPPGWNAFWKPVASPTNPGSMGHIYD